MFNAWKISTIDTDTYTYNRTITLPFRDHPRPTTMGTCTLEFTRNSPLRTTLVDGTSGQVIYQIDTPIRILVGHVTRVRKLDLPPQSPLILGDKAHSDICDDLTDKEKKKGGFKWNEMFKTDLPQTSDEIGRINWKFFSPSGFDFKGKVTNRREFLPECGKTKK